MWRAALGAVEGFQAGGSFTLMAENKVSIPVCLCVFSRGRCRPLGWGKVWAGIGAGSGAWCQHAVLTERPRSSAAPSLVLATLPWGAHSREHSGTGPWLCEVDTPQRRKPRSGHTGAVERELSRGLCRGAAGNPRFPRLLPGTLGTEWVRAAS